MCRARVDCTLPLKRPRSASSLSVTDQQELFGSLWRAPLVWLMLNVLRFVLIVAFRCVAQQPLIVCQLKREP